MTLPLTWFVNGALKRILALFSHPLIRLRLSWLNVNIQILFSTCSYFCFECSCKNRSQPWETSPFENAWCSILSHLAGFGYPLPRSSVCTKVWAPNLLGEKGRGNVCMVLNLSPLIVAPAPGFSCGEHLLCSLTFQSTLNKCPNYTWTKMTLFSELEPWGQNTPWFVPKDNVNFVLTVCDPCSILSLPRPAIKFCLHSDGLAPSSLVSALDLAKAIFRLHP